jgi:uncharacterized protein (TIGR02246 family)
MLKLVSILGGLLLIGLSLSCERSGGERDRERDLAQINQLFEQVVTATENGDALQYASLYTEDAVVMERDRASIEGRDAIGHRTSEFFEEYNCDVVHMFPKRTEIALKWAFVHYEVAGTCDAKEGSESFVFDLKCLDILERQPDDSWQVSRHMCNPNAPTDSTDE